MELDENQCQDPADHINQRLKLKPFTSVTNLCVFFIEYPNYVDEEISSIDHNENPYQNAFL